MEKIEKKWSNKTLGGYSVIIKKKDHRRIYGEYFFLGEWHRQSWLLNGMKSKNSLFKMDIDLVEIPTIR